MNLATLAPSRRAGDCQRGAVHCTQISIVPFLAKLDVALDQTFLIQRVMWVDGVPNQAPDTEKGDDVTLSCVFPRQKHGPRQPNTEQWDGS